MEKLWDKLKILYLKYKLYFYVGLGILVLIFYFNIKINILKNQNEKYINDIKVKNALLDSMHIYKNKLGEVTSEKLTLQFELKNQKDYNNQLNENQKELLKRIDKNNNIISAALIKMQVKIDSLLSKDGVYDPLNKSINFNDSTKDLQYDITAINVKPVDTLLKTKLLFNNLSFPNKQYIEFKWNDNKKEGFPISFSLSNSNIYFKVYDVDSYIIPEIKKEVLKPNFWQKLNKFGNTTVGNSIKIGIGVGVGYLLFNK